MTRKGGGRDSEFTKKVRAIYGPKVKAIEITAADPAVESLADFIIPKAAVNPAAYGLFSTKNELFLVIRERDERIRELEAAGDDLYVECKKQFDRAERAEAALQKALHARDERSLSAQREWHVAALFFPRPRGTALHAHGRVKR